MKYTFDLLNTNGSRQTELTINAHQSGYHSLFGKSKGHFSYVLSTLAKIITMAALVAMPVSTVYSEEQESLSPLSKPIEGQKPVIETGEIWPTLDGILKFDSNSTFSEQDKFGDVDVLLETPLASDLDKDEAPNIRLEPTLDNQTNQPKPLLQWALLDALDPATGPKQPLSLTQTDNAIRIVDVAPGRKIELTINANLIPFTLTGFPREGDPEDRTESFVFQVPKRTPGVMSDNFYSPINAPFPTIGFKNAKFFVITPTLASDYNWEIDGASLELASVNGVGSLAEVTLLKQPAINPDEYHTIRVIATPKTGESVQNPVITHSFTLTRWLIYGPEVLAGKPMPVLYEDGLAACKTLGDIYGIPRANFLVQPFNDGTDASRSLTGSLWNEWGNISNVSQEPWVLTGQAGFEGYYHTFDQTLEGQKVAGHLGNGLSKLALIDQALNLVCAVNLDGTPLDTPQLRNFILSGELVIGNTPIASYTFDPATNEELDPFKEDNSLYTWGYKGETTTGQGNKKVLVESGINILAHGKVSDIVPPEIKEIGITEFKLPALTANEIGKVLELSVQPINIDNEAGPILTITTDMALSGGNQTYTRFMRVDGSKTQVIDTNENGVIKQNITFPRTGFEGAFFTLGLETGLSAKEFDWAVEKGAEWASVDQDGVVKLLKMPSDENQEVIIKGVSKEQIYKPILQFDAIRASQAPITYTYKFTLKQWYFGNPGGTPLTRYEADQLCYALNKEYGVENFAIPSFKYQLFDVKTVDNNKATSFINFNGMLYNEWGDLRAFSESQFKSQYFWVAEIGPSNNRKLNRRATWDTVNLQATGDKSDQSGDLSAQTQMICGRNLDGTDFYAVPRLKDFRLSGAIAEGSKLTVSYYFLQNNIGASPQGSSPSLNGAKLTDANLASIDLSTYASSYQGGQTGPAVLVTNTRINTLTPISSVYDPTTRLYRAEYILGPLPAGSQDNIISISARPIIAGDLSGLIRTIDSTMKEEEGNYTYRGFASVETVKNKYTFYGRELESMENFPTTGFKGAAFRLNSSANASIDTNPKYRWSIHFDALDPEEGVDASEYYDIGQEGAEAGNVTMLKKPPFNRRAYVTAINKDVPEDKLAYSFFLQKWYDPNLNNFNAFHSVSTPQNAAEFKVNQPIDPAAEDADFSQTFPTTGFPGAKFKLNIGVNGALNSQYDWWTSEDEKPYDDRAIRVNELGEVLLVNRPEFNSTQTVYAQLKDKSYPPIAYTYKLLKWFNPMMGSDFFSIQTPLSAAEFKPVTQPPKKRPDDFTGVFPTTGFPGALFRLNLGGTNGRDNLLYNWSSSHPELASVGNGPLVDSTPEGAGNVVLLKDPEVATEITIYATPKPDKLESTKVLEYRFKVIKWFNQNLPNINKAFYSAETFLSDAEHPINQPRDWKTNPNANFSNVFPTTGFPGAMFRLNIGFKGGRDNALYTWESSHPELVSVGNNGVVGTTKDNAGNVMLLSDPEVATPVTITATPIEGASENVDVLTYTFKVVKWFNQDLPLNGAFYSAQTFLSDFEHPIVQPKDAQTDENADFSKTFPTTGFPGAIFRLNIGNRDGLFNQNYTWESSHPTLASVGNGPNSNTSTGAGNVTLLVDPEVATPITITATPKDGVTSTNPVIKYTFKVVKWFNQDLPPANANFYSAETFLSDAEHPIVQPKNAETDPDADFSKTFPTTGFPGAIFRLNIGSKGGQFNADYNWSTSEDSKPESERLIKVGNSGTVNNTETGSGNVTLIRDPDVATPVTVVAVPKGGASSTNPEIRYTFKVIKWFNPDLSPQSSNNDFYSVGTFKTNFEHPVVQPEDVTAADADFSKTFPTTGFPGAIFRLNIGDGTGRDNGLYNWSIENPAHSEYVMLGNNGTPGTNADNAGNVTLIKDPEVATVITIIATPNPDKTQDTRVLRYSFKVIKWFNQDLKPFASFNSITLPKDGTNLPLVEASAGNYDKVFPQTGFKNAVFRLNIGDNTGARNSEFDWRSSDISLATVNASGEVTLVKRPAAPTVITITATPKDTSSGEASLNYSFKLAKWFDVNLAPPVGRFSVITLPLDEDNPLIPVTLPNGTNFDEVFPQTGFTNAMFRLNIGAVMQTEGKNDEYTWTISDPELAKVGNTTGLNSTNIEASGNVTLLKRPAAPTVITVTATNKVNPLDVLTYQFKLAKWFEPNLEAIITNFSSITTPLDEAVLAVNKPDGNDFSDVFPQTGFTNAMFRLDIKAGNDNILLNDAYDWTVNPEASEYVSIGNGAIDNTATGAGNVTLLKRPSVPTVVTITATPKGGETLSRKILTYQFRVAKWFETQTTPIISTFSRITTVYDNATIDINAPNGEDFTNVFPRTGFTNARFRLDIIDPNDDEVLLNSQYDWAVTASEANIVLVGNSGVVDSSLLGSGNVTLLKRPSAPTVVTVTATPKPEFASSYRKVLTYQFRLDKWFETQTKAQNAKRYHSISLPYGNTSDATAGAMTSIAIIDHEEGDYSKVFPRTGFVNATFRLNIGAPTALLNDDYNWSLLEDGTEGIAYVGNSVTTGITKETAGVVTLTKRPDVPTVVTVIATPKNEITEETPVLTYKFRTDKWFAVDLLRPVENFEGISLMYGTSSSILMRDPVQIGVSTPVGDDFSQVFPQTGFKNAKFRLDIGRSGGQNRNYTWAVNRPDLVKVGNQPLDTYDADSAGIVTLLKRPEAPTEIVITATPPRITSTTPVLTYRFKLVKWFDVNLDKPLLRFNSITNPTNDVLTPIPVIAAKNGDYSQTYPRTGFSGAMFRLNIGNHEAPLNEEYTWSTSEDSKPVEERLVSVGNGVVSATNEGAGNVTLLRRPNQPTEITIYARVKPEFMGTRPELRPELRYTFKTQKWFDPAIQPTRLTKAFTSLSAFTSSYNIVNPVGSDFTDVFPTYGGKELTFKLSTPDFVATDLIWTSSDESLVAVDNQGNVTFINEPSIQTEVIISARPRFATDISVYEYRFKVKKWIQISPDVMNGYYQAAPNARWPENIWGSSISNWPWLQSLGESNVINNPVNNPDLYCQSLGNGYQSMSVSDYTLNYPDFIPFSSSAGANVARIKIGAFVQEWGRINTMPGVGNRAAWLAEPISVNLRAASGQGTTIATNQVVSNQTAKALCVRTIPIE
ncbi:hypothetical protein [Thorsellia anophelis]|uniref:BIG2 domain-containing protein n=1 Tax=Thorsellia anophelis DSM 18579 TaxID=1123402 RepID=A0A1I0ANY9_9GAMM|nr:hypothetical protein [Thorsellia anophelis]SES95139.1 hypothetical protein SAMN02583745_00966 [Thorsellia anophelis DSM 18579]